MGMEEEQIIKDYLNYLLVKGYDEKSSRYKVSEAGKFLNCLRKRINEITSTDINLYYKQLESKTSKKSGRPIKPSTLCHKILSIEHFFEMLFIRGKITAKPQTSYKVPKEEEKYQREILTQTEIQQLYDSADMQQTVILDLAYGCGLRVSELVAVNLSDVYLKENMLIVPKGKLSKRRIVPLTGKITKDITNYLAQEKYAGTELIRNSQGNRMQKWTYNKILKKLLRKINLPEKRIKEISVHSLRHSIATHLIENGMELEKVQEFLGHNHLETTETYTHISMKQLKNMQKNDT